jgi:hypothetical protein
VGDYTDYFPIEQFFFFNLLVLGSFLQLSIIDRCSVIGMATSYSLDGPGIESWQWESDFIFSKTAQTGSGVH